MSFFSISISSFAGIGLEAKVKTDTSLRLGHEKFCGLGLGRHGLNYSFGSEKFHLKTRFTVPLCLKLNENHLTADISANIFDLL